jgi:hypothetical protein
MNLTETYSIKPKKKKTHHKTTYPNIVCYDDSHNDTIDGYSLTEDDAD